MRDMNYNCYSPASKPGFRNSPKPERCGLGPAAMDFIDMSKLRQPTAEQPLSNVEVAVVVSGERVRAVKPAGLKPRSNEVAVCVSRVWPAVPLRDAGIRADMLDKLVVLIQDGHAGLGEVG